MPLTPEEQRELAELEELERLEAQFGDSIDQAATEKAPDSSIIPSGKAFGTVFENEMALGYLPQLKGIEGKLQSPEDENAYVRERDVAAKTLQDIEYNNPLAALLGKGAAYALPGPGMARGLAKLGKSATKQILGMSGLGALLGAARNPGDEAGQIDPMQLEQRGENAVVGGLVGAGAGATGQLIQRGARTSQMQSRLKDPYQLSKDVKGEIDAALAAAKKGYVQPRAEALKASLADQTVQVHPERIEGIDPVVDRYAAMLKRRQQMPDPEVTQVLPEDEIIAASGQPIAQTKPLPPIRSMPINATVANKLKQKAAQAAQHYGSQPFDPASKVKSQKAAAIAGKLRGQLEEIDPNVERLNAEMQEYYKVSDPIRRQSASRPITAISSRDPTKEGLVQRLDEMAGSNLAETADDIALARSLQMMKPSDVSNPLHYLSKPAIRSVNALSQGLSKLPKGTSPATVNALVDYLTTAEPRKK